MEIVSGFALHYSPFKHLSNKEKIIDIVHETLCLSAALKYDMVDQERHCMGKLFLFELPYLWLWSLELESNFEFFQKARLLLAGFDNLSLLDVSFVGRDGVCGCTWCTEQQGKLSIILCSCSIVWGIFLLVTDVCRKADGQQYLRYC